MSFEIVHTPHAPSSPFFSQAVKAGPLLFLSGLIGMDLSTGQMAGLTIEEQTRQAMLNCEAVLNAAGATLDHVCDVLVLLADPADFAGFNQEYVKFFKGAPPARAVAKLGVAVENVLVSIKMSAYLET